MEITSIPKTIDTLVIAGKGDIRLLRYFFVSNETFSKLGGVTYLFIWRSEQYLLDQIEVPKDTEVHYKDDIDGMVSDDFRNQMYIKVIADKYIKNEWFWIADADYLLCDYLKPEDFFNVDNGRAHWFYRRWDGGPPEQRWRAGAEMFLRRSVPYLFLDEAQFLMNRNVLKNFRRQFDIGGLLHQNPMPADCLVYGAYAFEEFNEMYEWIEINSVHKIKSIGYKVNQQPPSYCLLDPDANLASLPVAKYYVFWSYWELAEQKMREFILAAMARKNIGLNTELDDCDLNIRMTPAELLNQRIGDLPNVHLDGWVHSNFKLLLANECFDYLELSLFSPERALHEEKTGVIISINGEHIEKAILESGENRLLLKIKRDETCLISILFSNGILEPNGSRTLFAMITSIRLINEV